MSNCMIRTTALLLATNLTAATLAASVLSFEFDPPYTAGQLIPQEYGDRIGAAVDGNFLYGLDGGTTENIEVSYFGNASPQQLSHWTTGYDDLVGVAYFEPDSASSFGIRFTADTNYEVTLESFDLGYYISSDILPGITITDANNNVVFSQTNISVGAGTALSFSPNVSDSELTLTLNTSGTGGASDNFGLDNIRFSQSFIPEPSTAALLAGFLAFGCVLRRRK